MSDSDKHPRSDDRHGHSGRKPNRLINEQSPVPASARLQSRRVVCLGRRGAGACEGRKQTHPALDWVLGVPLVPCDGARIVREREHRAPDERKLRADQSRSRRTARPRPDLHGSRANNYRPRRMAAHNVPHAGGETVFRRNLFSARSTARACRGFLGYLWRSRTPFAAMRTRFGITSKS